MPTPTPDGYLIEAMLFLTGREDRLTKEPVLDDMQLQSVRAIVPLLQSTAELIPRCDLLNRLLLTLGIKTVSPILVDCVFSDVDLKDESAVRSAVDRFRIVCMMEYGSFRHGFRKFRSGAALREVWTKYFPSEANIADTEARMRSRPRPVGIERIPADQLFSLGYLAGQHAATINTARTMLRGILERALAKGVDSWSALVATASEESEEALPILISRAGVPGAETLAHSDLPLFSSAVSYADRLKALSARCTTMDADAINATRRRGEQNSRAYMAMHDLDVYVATSMREPLHFTSNWAFVQRLFHEGELADWNLRYFDPTQSYLADRIQKGLLECLMIKRARVTVYNAQEEDTFGKDAEAGVTLAQRKPVIVYVARLFESQLKNIYAVFDRGTRLELESFVDELIAEQLIPAEQRESFLEAGGSKRNAIASVIRTHATQILRELGNERIAIELIREGYDAGRHSDSPLEFSINQILRLEGRAATFRDSHPLSLQTSPIDGVARGVIVTRSVSETARVLKAIFLGNLKYSIRDDELNWLLVDAVTQSPVRVVTKDPLLTTAFWTETWATNGSEPRALAAVTNE